MQIRKCDHCKKKLSEYPSKEGIHGSIGGSIPEYLALFDLCDICGKKFLSVVQRYVRIKAKKQYGKKR